MADTDNIIDIDNLSILDQDLDDIADLAGFDVPWNGEYILGLSCETKAVKGKASVVLNYRLESVIKQDDPDEKPYPKDTKFGQLFMLEGKEESVQTALSALKGLVAPIGEHIGEGKMSKILKWIQEQGEILVGATVKRRVDKEDKEKVYANVKNIRMQ